MNQRFTPLTIALMCLSGWLAASPLTNSEQSSDDDVVGFVQKYNQASGQEKLLLIREFATYGPENFGEASIGIIEDALVEEDPDIRYMGLSALHRLSAAKPESVDALRFKPLLESALNSADAGVRSQARAVTSSLSLREESLGSILVDALEGAATPAAAADILRRLPPSMVRDLRVTRDLIVMSQSPAGPESFGAARALLRSEVYAPELLPELIRLIQDDSYFGRQALTEGISQYGADSAAYVAILVRVRDELEADLNRSPFERTKNVRRDESGAINIVEDPGALDALDELIRTLQAQAIDPGKHQ